MKKSVVLNSDRLSLLGRYIDSIIADLKNGRCDITRNFAYDRLVAVRTVLDILEIDPEYLRKVQSVIEEEIG